MYRFECHSDDTGLLADLLAAAAGGAADLVHHDPDAPRTDSVLIESAANGFLIVRLVDGESGEPEGDAFPIDIDAIETVSVW